MFTISPSIYSADLLDLKNVLKSLKGFEHLHLDVDDGNFVSGISFGTDTIKRISEECDIPLDAHLEVLNPLNYVDELCTIPGMERICAHVEALEFPSAFLSKVKKYDVMAGLSLNIKTPVSFIEPYKDQLDYILFVSVESDSDGLPFRKGILPKVEAARKYFGDNIDIWVDGGLNETNLKSVIDAGANAVVIGRGVFGAKDVNARYSELLALGRKYEREKNEI